MNKLGESIFTAYAYLSEATQTMGVNRMFVLKARTVNEIATGVTGSFPTIHKEPIIKTPQIPASLIDLSRQGTERPETNLKTPITEEAQVDLPNGPVRISGSDALVTGITVLSRKQHKYLAAPASDPLMTTEQAILVTFERGRNEIQLTVGVDNRRSYTSYRDRQFDASDSSYFPDQSASHPPYHNRLHKWRDIVVGAKEELAIALMVDTALRTALGEDKGFSNHDEILSLYKLIDENIGIYQKKLYVRPPPPHFHAGIVSLFNDIVPLA